MWKFFQGNGNRRLSREWEQYEESGRVGESRSDITQAEILLT